MKQQDLKEFTQAIVTVYQIFGRELNADSVKAMFGALAKYPLNDVKNALQESLKRCRYCPTISEVIAILDEFYGINEGALKRQANDFYNIINRNFTSLMDVVTDDARAVFAFKQCFSSLDAFGMHTEQADPFDRKAFIDAYLKVQESWIDFNNPESYLLKGVFHSQNPRVRFIGDMQKCKELHKAIYGERKTRPQLPNSTAAQPKFLENVKEKYVDLAEIERSKQELERLVLSYREK